MVRIRDYIFPAAGRIAAGDIILEWCHLNVRRCLHGAAVVLDQLVCHLVVAIVRFADIVVDRSGVGPLLDVEFAIDQRRARQQVLNGCTNNIMVSVWIT